MATCLLREQGIKWLENYLSRLAHAQKHAEQRRLRRMQANNDPESIDRLSIEASRLIVNLHRRYVEADEQLFLKKIHRAKMNNEEYFDDDPFAEI